MTGAILFAIVASGIATGTSAQDVRRSGNTYYKAVCGEVSGNRARCMAEVVTDALGNELQYGSSRFTGYTASDLRDAYKITKAGKSSTIIALVDAYGYDNAESDLGVYRSAYGLPACTTANGCFKKLNQTGQQGPYPAQNNDWARESALDVDMASAMCPNCQVWLVEATNNTLDNLTIAENTAASLGAHAISNSYASKEQGNIRYESAYNHPGIAITASSGDNGYADGPQFPASSPHVIAVGGTHLTTDSSDRGWTESAWIDAGSGCSTNFDKPAWQKDTTCTKRMVADVSADADPATGVSVYGPNSGGVAVWQRVGGTSASAPLVAGLYAANGKPVKTYAKTLYGKKASVFDVTSGNNGTCGGTYYCTAVPGYDGPTGVGTPDGPKSFH